MDHGYLNSNKVLKNIFEYKLIRQFIDEKAASLYKIEEAAFNNQEIISF